MPPIELPGICKIATTGKTVIVTSTTATGSTAIPVDSNGQPAKILRVIADHNCHIQFGANGAANSATQNDILLTPNGGADYFNVKGQAAFSICLDSGSSLTAVVNLVAVEL